jgi:hypothetical protein
MLTTHCQKHIESTIVINDCDVHKMVPKNTSNWILKGRINWFKKNKEKCL